MGMGLTSEIFKKTSIPHQIHQTTPQTIAMATLHYLPPVKPSAIALGTVFNHAVSLAVLAPVFGETSHQTSHRLSPSAPSSTTPSLWPSLPQSLARPTTALRPRTPRRSSSSQRRLPPLLLAGARPCSARLCSRMALVL